MREKIKLPYLSLPPRDELGDGILETSLWTREESEDLVASVSLPVAYPKMVTHWYIKKSGYWIGSTCFLKRLRVD